jgi:hypothetical protein
MQRLDDYSPNTYAVQPQVHMSFAYEQRKELVTRYDIRKADLAQSA